MGKNNRHQRNLKSERSKVQLRVKNVKTKFLPKGQNVTKTDFKIKAIVIPQQFHQHHDGELLSKRKLNIKDIVSRLKHQNSNVRSACAEEMRQLLAHHVPEIVDFHLAQVLQGLAPLLLDEERKLRRTGVEIFNAILAATTETKVSPFFHILSSYLRCSMTNINAHIQEDSLLFFDVLLEHTPHLITSNRDKILPNLFTLISKLKSDSGAKRTLTVNLQSKITNVEWRLLVLGRLYKFLNASIQQRADEESMPAPTYYYQKTNKIAFYHNPYLTSNDAMVTSSDTLLEYVPTLMTMLHEIWLEAAPNKVAASQTVLNNEVAAILSCILNIVDLLSDHVTDMNILLNNGYKNLLKNLLALFPFMQRNDGGKRSNVERVLNMLQSDTKMFRENCLIALMHQRTLDDNLEEENTTLDHIIVCLSDRSSTKPHNLEVILKLARVVLLESNSEHEEFFNAFMEHISRMTDDAVFDILFDVAQVEHLSNNVKYNEWLATFPQNLCGDCVSIKLLETMLLIVKQGNGIITEKLHDLLPSILDNFATIQITDCDDQKLGKLKILHVLYYVKKMSDRNVERLYEFLITCEDCYKEMVNVIIQNS